MGSHSVLSIISDDGEGTRRRGIRARVLLAATLATSTREVSVRLRDVAAYGARIDGADLPERGTVVMLRRGTFERFGRVVWTGNGTAGVEFDEPLNDADLLANLRGLPTAVAAPEPYRRPGLGREADPPRLSTGDGWLRSLPGRA